MEWNAFDSLKISIAERIYSEQEVSHRAMFIFMRYNGRAVWLAFLGHSLTLPTKNSSSPFTVSSRQNPFLHDNY